MPGKTPDRYKISLDIMLAIENLAQAHHEVHKMDDPGYIEERLDQTFERLEKARERVKLYREKREG